LYTGLRDNETFKKKETGLKFNFKTQKEIDWRKVKKGKRNNNQEQLRKQLQDKKKYQTRSDDPEKQAEEQKKQDVVEKQ
jgi:hypothetical protein